MINEGCCVHHKVWLGFFVFFFAGELQKMATMARNCGLQRKGKTSSFFKAEWMMEHPLSSGFPSDLCLGTRVKLS